MIPKGMLINQLCALLDDILDVDAGSMFRILELISLAGRHKLSIKDAAFVANAMVFVQDHAAEFAAGYKKAMDASNLMPYVKAIASKEFDGDDIEGFVHVRDAHQCAFETMNKLADVNISKERWFLFDADCMVVWDDAIMQRIQAYTWGTTEELDTEYYWWYGKTYGGECRVPAYIKTSVFAAHIDDYLENIKLKAAMKAHVATCNDCQEELAIAGDSLK